MTDPKTELRSTLESNDHTHGVTSSACTDSDYVFGVDDTGGVVYVEELLPPFASIEDVSVGGRGVSVWVSA